MLNTPTNAFVKQEATSPPPAPMKPYFEPMSPPECKARRSLFHSNDPFSPTPERTPEYTPEVQPEEPQHSAQDIRQLIPEDLRYESVVQDRSQTYIVFYTRWEAEAFKLHAKSTLGIESTIWRVEKMPEPEGEEDAMQDEPKFKEEDLYAEGEELGDLPEPEEKESVEAVVDRWGEL